MRNNEHILYITVQHYIYVTSSNFVNFSPNNLSCFSEMESTKYLSVPLLTIVLHFLSLIKFALLIARINDGISLFRIPIPITVQSFSFTVLSIFPAESSFVKNHVYAILISLRASRTSNNKFANIYYFRIYRTIMLFRIYSIWD